MRAVTAYESEDGHLYRSEEEAVARDARQELIELLDSSALCRGDGACDVADWVIGNASRLRALIDVFALTRASQKGETR